MSLLSMLGLIPQPRARMVVLTARQADNMVKSLVEQRNELANGICDIVEIIFTEFVDPKIDELRKDPIKNLSEIERIAGLKGRLQQLTGQAREVYR